MDLQLKGRRVLITGGSKGIGLAIAQEFAAAGALPVLVAREADALRAGADGILKKYGVKVEVVVADLSLSCSSEDVFNQAGEVDIVINNAGSIPAGNLQEIDEATWRKAWDLKLYSYVNLTRLYLDYMQVRRTGVIINIIGMAGAAPRYDYICGSAANAALIAFTQAVGAFSVQFGVRVLGINPPATRTDRMESMFRYRATHQLKNTDRWHELAMKLPFGSVSQTSPFSLMSVIVAGAAPARIVPLRVVEPNSASVKSAQPIIM